MLQTKAERAAADQPQLGGNGVFEDQPDPSGEEMSENARVWKTYLRETGRSDKEAMTGPNNSMDVLLRMYSGLPGRTPTVAALFSAISTAFIIESLGDLKPNHAESSAQTLLLMSKTLTALTNGQPAPLSPEDGPSSAAFSPPRSAVIVNAIWLLSLSLSVAVSLIAMLAKDWCYSFLSRRSVPIYQQAIQRQQKWNGMEQWKMTLVLENLPLAMHLALHEIHIASIGSALDYVTSSLESHLREDGIILSATVLHALVKASVHYLVGRWPREEDHGQHCSFPVLLARVFVTCYDTAPDTAQAAALALAAGAFANYTYPGGEEPTPDVDAREKRAVQMLQHYQANKPDTHQLLALYIFGFYSWLPWFISND
ncbi:hypothetical protein FRC07_002881 [Ceratobasidium sp. 392]|nr:hypothetical protein FRC07_002881 [Ceratobasidium sp. 392]